MPSSSNSPKLPKKAKAAASKPAVPKDAAKALASIESKPKQLSPEDLIPINLDIPRAVSIAIAAVPQLAKLRQDALALPGFEIAHMDHIGTYALAAWHAHLMALPALPSTAFAKLLEEAKPLREHMLLAAELLAHAGYFEKSAVEAIRSGLGNLDTANDLVALSALFTAIWSDVEHRSTITWANVQRAAELGPQMLIALGERDREGVPDAGPMDTNERKKRAFTLFMNAYDQCRRAAAYLRWNEGDAEAFAPSLFGTRKARTETEASGSPEESETGAPEA